MIIAIVALLLLNSAWRYFAYLRLDLVPAASASATVEMPAEMILVRREYLLQAASPGEFIPLVEEGCRVGAGAVVGYLQSSPLNQAQQNVTTANSGVVSYALDGWEEALTPDNVYQTDWLKTLEFMREENAVQALAEAETAVPNLSAGRNLAKVMDNLETVMAFVCCDTAPASLAAGDMLTLNIGLAGQDTLVSGSISTLGQLSNGQWICLVDLGKNEACLAAQRYQRVAVVGKTVSGVGIPESALLINGEGQTGVYRRDVNSLEFAPVEVLLRRDGQAIVSGLAATDLVAANPDKAKEGQRLY